MNNAGQKLSCDFYATLYPREKSSRLETTVVLVNDAGKSLFAIVMLLFIPKGKQKWTNMCSVNE